MMKPHIPDFSSARLLVIGDLMLDRYWHGDTSRISPEAPVPVVLVGQAEERPGGAGNVALNIVRLGAHAVLLGLTGEDEAADALEQRLSAAGVQCRFERLSGFSTVTKLRVLSRHQQLIRLDFEDGFRGHDGTGLMARFHAALDEVDLVVCSDYGKGSLRAVEMLIDAARAAGKPVVVDPKGSDFNRYRGARVITPNQHEFEAVVGRCENDEELVERGQLLCQELDLDALLITRSERGMTLLRADQPALHLPTHAREVFDVTGAGDTVVSVLGAALAAGQPLDEAMALANLAAGVVVGKLGTASVSVAELYRAMREIDAVPHGVVDEAPLLRLVQDARAHGETVVMTNGCFDILHAGHVAYLRQAHERGDRLIVAVNDDASVARLKGEGRPINDLEGRMAVLAGLEGVDWVVPFTEDTPERLICAVLPDVLVKGGDYHPEQVAGGRCVLENGGEVVILDFVDGRSTSRIIDTIRAQSD